MNTHDSEGLSVDIARPEDATAIVHIHFAAVHQTAAAWYSEEVRLAWSPPVNEERIERMRLVIERPDEVTLVVRFDGAVVGFGSLLPADCELRAVYVHPQWGRRGVGTLLLQSLEEQAQDQGVSFLQMDASLNAQRFYERNGFRVLARGVHRFRSGQEINCMRMRKDLPVPGLPATEPTASIVDAGAAMPVRTVVPTNALG
jgi:putative acetyltransferase